MMKFKELKNKSDKGLEAELVKAKEDLQILKFRVAGRQFKDVREIRVVKRLISQILTLQKQRKMTGQVKEETNISKAKETE